MKIGQIFDIFKFCLSLGEKKIVLGRFFPHFAGRKLGHFPKVLEKKNNTKENI